MPVSCQRFAMEPENDEEYKRFLKRRLVESSTKKEHELVKTIDEEEEQALQKRPKAGILVSSFAAVADQAAARAKTTMLDVEELKFVPRSLLVPLCVFPLAAWSVALLPP